MASYFVLEDQKNLKNGDVNGIQHYTYRAYRIALSH